MLNLTFNKFVASNEFGIGTVVMFVKVKPFCFKLSIDTEANSSFDDTK